MLNMKYCIQNVSGQTKSMYGIRVQLCTESGSRRKLSLLMYTSTIDLQNGL